MAVGRRMLLVLGVLIFLAPQFRLLAFSSSKAQDAPITGNGSLETQRGRRTAVVWTTTGVTTDCEAARIRHLVQTCGVGMDVWVLHAHPILAKRGLHPDVETSGKFIASIPGLHQASQSQVAFEPLDEGGGSGRSSFLRFLAEHSEYDYAWIVENDLFYTGPWEDIFRPEMEEIHSSTDFLASAIYHQNRDWFWLQNCRVLGKLCVDWEPRLQVHWMFARVSSRFAKAFVKDLDDGHIQGHHEAIVGPYHHSRGFSLDAIDQSRLGKIGAGGGNLGEEKMTVESRDPLPGRLVHPVQCAAYRDDTASMQREIEKWCGEKCRPLPTAQTTRSARELVRKEYALLGPDDP